MAKKKVIPTTDDLAEMLTQHICYARDMLGDDFVLDLMYYLIADIETGQEKEQLLEYLNQEIKH